MEMDGGALLREIEMDGGVNDFVLISMDGGVRKMDGGAFVNKKRTNQSVNA